MEQTDVMTCLNERASVRSFLDQDIPEKVMNELYDAACHGATGGNLQPYSIIEVRSAQKKQELMDTKRMQPIVEQAPISLLFCVDWHRSERWANLNHAPFSARDGFRHFWIAFQDTIIAAQNICTAAEAKGIGSVYLGTVESCFDELRDIFKLPEGVFPIVLLSLGYPKKYPAVASKLMPETIVSKEVYHELSDEELNRVMDEKYSDRPRTPLSDQNVEQLYEVTKEIDGEEAADEAVAYAKKLGYIHMAQRYFALHYPANWSNTGTKEFMESLQKGGYLQKGITDGIQ